jgi:hypothetical protein
MEKWSAAAGMLAGILIPRLSIWGSSGQFKLVIIFSVLVGVMAVALSSRLIKKAFPRICLDNMSISNVLEYARLQNIAPTSPLLVWLADAFSGVATFLVGCWLGMAMTIFFYSKSTSL